MTTDRLPLEAALRNCHPAVTPGACLLQDVIVLATSPAHSLRTSTTRATRGYGSSEGSIGDSSAAGSSTSELGASCDVEGSAADNEAAPDGSSPPLGPAVVDRLDSAHYEVRPAGLVERQDSAHEVNAQHLVTAGLMFHYVGECALAAPAVVPHPQRRAICCDTLPHATSCASSELYVEAGFRPRAMLCLQAGHPNPNPKINLQPNPNVG